MTGLRDTIYYWKCDRPAALHGVGTPKERGHSPLLPRLQEMLEAAFHSSVVLKPSGGSGNHHTYLLEHRAGVAFVRVEDGPEGDGHLEMESRVLGEVAATGVPVPRVLFTDASRKHAPFAVQVIEYFDCVDLNCLHRAGRLPLVKTAREIGRNLARWQATPVSGFGPFDPTAPNLHGYHDSYSVYFQLHLERHLRLLREREFLSETETGELHLLLAGHARLLEIGESVLVHKDLALWNIMGTEKSIAAFIDWDDAIAGDPTDDLSLLACFHPAAAVSAAVNGYAEVRPLPERFIERFWLHLLRNMIVKAVIRCEAGYFEQKAGGAFLMASGQDGVAFREFTRQRLLTACRGLKHTLPISEL